MSNTITSREVLRRCLGPSSINFIAHTQEAEQARSRRVGAFAPEAAIANGSSQVCSKSHILSTRALLRAPVPSFLERQEGDGGQAQPAVVRNSTAARGIHGTEQKIHFQAAEDGQSLRPVATQEGQ